MAWLWTWNPWNDYSQWGAKRQGKRDGSKGIPKQDQALNPPYIMALKQVGEQAITQLAQGWENRDRKLLAEYCKAMKEAQRLVTLEKKSRKDFEASSGDRLAAREEYIKHFHISPWAYLILLSLISVAEFFFNTVVFQLFGENKMATMLTALGIALSFPVLAHALGGWLRHGFLIAGKFGVHTALILLDIFVVVSGLIAIAYVREKFLEGQGIDKMLGIQMDPTVVTVVFIVCNLVLFVASAILSYIEHNPDANQYRLRLQDAEKLYRSSQRRLKELEILDARNQDRRATIKAERGKLFNHAQHEAKEWRDNTQMVMSVYRMENLRVRDEATMPECFNSFPPIDVPAALDPNNGTLDWDCSKFLDLQPEPQLIGADSENGDNLPQVKAAVEVEA